MAARTRLEELSDHDLLVMIATKLFGVSGEGGFIEEQNTVRDEWQNFKENRFDTCPVRDSDAVVVGRKQLLLGASGLLVMGLPGWVTAVILWFGG